MHIYCDRLKKTEWDVRDCDFRLAKEFIIANHYAKGGSNTFVFCHGLFHRSSEELKGVAWWLPPTRVAAESVNKLNWKSVLSLTRLAISPDVPKNAATFLIAKSIKLIKKDGRFVSLVTYADESQAHTGGIYRAGGWDYIGRTPPYPRWVNPVDGRQVSPKATVNRTKSQMEDLGLQKIGSFSKHKFVKHLTI